MKAAAVGEAAAARAARSMAQLAATDEASSGPFLSGRRRSAESKSDEFTVPLCRGPRIANAEFARTCRQGIAS